MIQQPIRLGRFEVAVPGLFLIPLKKLTVESDPNVNRTYLLRDGRIVAVGRIEPQGRQP